MLFNSTEFFWFMAVVLPAYYLLPARTRGLWRVLFMVAASYLFYMYWDPRYIILIITSTLIDYGCGRLFLRWPKHRHRWIPIISATTNLTILGVFKYTDFFASTLNVLLLRPAFGYELPMVIKGYLPVGISFYTFQTMSYTLDIHRGEAKVEKSFWRFALYVSYFPQLVAGPIEKARNLLRRIEAAVPRPRPISPHLAVHQIAYGLFKKIAVADNIGPLVEPIFENTGAYGAGQILLASVLFSMQIYCDFSGYTDIAIGVSRLFGIELMRNFRFPYFSTSLTSFWRRWHISLSSWLKEYLYIPLGGNRRGELQMHAAILVTMLLGGLWHGPSWNFVLWGACHGVLLVGHKLWIKHSPLAGRAGPVAAAARAAVCLPLTFLVVTLIWIPFVCPDFQDTADAFRQLATWAPGQVGPLNATLVSICVLLSAVVAGYDIVLFWAEQSPLAARLTRPLRFAAPAACVVLTFIFAAPEAQQFVYFAF